ncbi:hypothetical protein [Miltoncostaea marina]|uniref:hypothetical protein n=1 Tax=Miltoncostaea marina TaxID=2843215 RepID=UPI001C3E30F8|nr:hypothetical protein [Miltoncostaea marina]
MSRVVALVALPMDADDVARVLAGLSRAYPGAVLGDSGDPRIIQVEDPHAPEGEDLVDLRRAA